MNFGRAIKTISAARGLTQRPLAARTGLTQSALSRLEREGSNPTMKTLARVAEALDTPVYLLVLLASDVDDLGDGAAATALAPQVLAILMRRLPT